MQFVVFARLKISTGLFVMISLVIFKKLLSPLGGVIFTPVLLGLELGSKQKRKLDVGYLVVAFDPVADLLV